MRKNKAAAIIGKCVLVVVVLCLLSNDSKLFATDDEEQSILRRYLKVTSENHQHYHGNTIIHPNQQQQQQQRHLEEEEDIGIYTWAQINLQPLSEPPKPKKEVPLFWHIPKCGGTTAKSIYECLDLTLANRAGALPQFGHDTDNFLLRFRPWGDGGASYVNADTTSYEGIDRAARLRLVQAHKADIIFTSYPRYAIEHLYNRNNKGRALGLFRHPVQRLVSKFYYLQIA